MAAVRRIYLYVVAAASLGMLLAGLANLGGALIELALASGSIGQGHRETLAGAIALVLVGLPVWALHWGWAQRMARRDAAERTSALRRLYLYGALACLLIGLMINGTSLLHQLLSLVLSTGERFDATSVVRTVWQTLLLKAFWLYHLHIAESDRAAVGEVGASATLRRWYAYGGQLVALVMLLFGSRELLVTVLTSLVQAGQVIWPSTGVVGDIARTLIALAVWAFHVRWTAHPPLVEADQRSTLRTVAAFLALALAVSLTLADTSRTLYYGLARLLGVDSPGGVKGDLLMILVNPLATVLIFGTAWWVLQRGLAADAMRSEAARQAGVRRLYRHLVSLLALFAFTGGLVALLFTLVDHTIGAQYANADSWRDELSRALTLVAVGLPMWLAHWRPAAALAERRALSRRLYLFAALLVAVLALLGSAATLVYRVLSLVLDIGGTQSPTADVARAISVSLIAAGMAAYHWRVLREDNAARELESGEAESSEEQPSSVGYRVEVTGATEGAIRQALDALPSGASYHISRLESPRATVS